MDEPTQRADTVQDPEDGENTTSTVSLPRGSVREPVLGPTRSAEYLLLAKTWNGNESGTLWECLWYRQDGRYYSKVCCPGFFGGPDEHQSEDAFWAHFEQDRAQFRGARYDGEGS